MPIRVPLGSPEPPGIASSSGPSLFARPSATSAQTLAAFRELKPVCVPIMGLHKLDATTYAHDLELLGQLRSKLHAFPRDSLDDTFTPPLINYAVFPLTNLLQRINPLDIRSRLLEEILLSLAFLVQRWKRAEGVPLKTWEQLWILVAIVLGGPPSIKGKRKELDDELKLACISLLEALLRPQDEEIGGPPTHPTQDMMTVLFTSKSLTPMLFHTVSALLDLLTPNPHAGMKTSALRLIRLLVGVYLEGKNEMLASVMPGAMSTLVKVVGAEGALLKTDVAAEICGLAAEVIVRTVNDEDMQRKGVLKSRVTKLSQLAEELAEDARTMGSTLETRDAAARAAFPDLTPRYLEFTQTQIMSALGHLVPALRKHPSSIVRSALVDSIGALAQQCARSLPLLQEPLLSSLLYLGKDDFDDVHVKAMSTLASLVRNSSTGRNVYDTLRTILERNISAFPQHVMARSDPRVLESTNIISTMAALVMETGDTWANPIQQLLGPDGGIQRWGMALLRCLELGEDRGVANGNSAAQRAWQLAQGQVAWQDRALIEGNPARPEETPYPEVQALYIESRQTFAAVGSIFADLGCAAGDQATFAVEYLVHLARNQRNGPDVALSASALWVVERLLEGLSRHAQPSPVIRKAVADVMVVIIGFDEDGSDGLGEDATLEESDALIPTERTRGIDSIALLHNKAKTRTPRQEQEKTRRLHLQRHRELATAHSLSIMAVCANILGVSFRPLLLRCLYIVLSYLGSSSPTLEQFASTALVRIAYHAGYASPQNLVMDNVDYVINVVSQRMTYRRLDVLAPMVLISMIRLVGGPIVPLVQDVVDDIFDVLDDFHGYDLLCSTFLAVLDTLIQAMAVDLPEWQPKATTSTRVQPLPEPKGDFGLLAEWYEQRGVRARTALEEMLAKAPQEPWKEEAEPGDENMQEPPSGTKDAPEIPPTRQQEVCKRIMDKSIYFMTHESAFIRTRVLSLFTAGIAVLIERETDLLPLVNRAWPYILNRLGDEEPYVVTEAARVIEALAHYVGDFMSRRILDHAWPAMKKLLDTQTKLDHRSALVKKGRGGDATYTVSHRLYTAIMDAIRYTVQEVPVNDALLWDMICTFLPFLDATCEDGLQSSAVQLYREMALRDEDAVWLALHAVQGDAGGGEQTYLRQPGLDIRRNLPLILA